MPRPVTPQIAIDSIIQLINKPGKPIVLIERLYPPFGWALPGGFMEVGETTEAGGCREALEETGLVITIVGLVGIYSDPLRDPRGHTVGITYAAQALGEPKAADDAKNVGLFTRDDLPAELAFDHAKILKDYFAAGFYEA